jgi:hypothetical protein
MEIVINFWIPLSENPQGGNNIDIDILFHHQDFIA